jgi:hypothetical protein
MPRWLADEKRLADVDAALQRYKDANLELPGEWLWERQDLLENLRRHRPAEAATVKESLTAPPAHTIAECGGPCEQDFRLCDCGLLQQLNPQRTPAPTTEARPGGLVERVAEAMQPGTFDWSAYEGEARAAIREVAAALLEWHYSDQVVHTAWEAAKWLQREADLGRRYQANAGRIEALKTATTCPHIVSSDGGTSYCRLAEQGAAPAAEAQPGGLVERVTARIEFGIDANQDPEGIARATIREVAAFLEAIQGQWRSIRSLASSVVAELVAELQQEADRA